MTDKVFRIGVVGYCPPTQFDGKEAHRMICEAFDKIASEHPDEDLAVVSGLTNVGVLGIAYTEAASRNWKTVGVACERALEHELFPVDEKVIVGKEWGDESETFLQRVDCMIRIGTGPQSIRETKAVEGDGKPTYEYDLPTL